MKVSYQQVDPFVTKDGSIIRELVHPASHHSQAQSLVQSLAEATVPVGATTHLHRHHNTEEIYHFTTGNGRMTLGDQSFDVVAGDTVCIKPGQAHKLENTADLPLVLLCSCSPAYADEDTELL